MNLAIRVGSFTAAFRSKPAQNTGPSPRSRTMWMAGSMAMRATAASSASNIARPRALRLPGSLRTIETLGAEKSTRTYSANIDITVSHK